MGAHLGSGTVADHYHSLWCQVRREISGCDVLFVFICITTRKNPCVINGDDQFIYLKQAIGLKSSASVTISA